jgi:Protein of unknown function (DUF998)
MTGREMRTRRVLGLRMCGWRLVGGLAGLGAAAAYSSFLLADVVGSRLDPVRSYVSELGASSQPASGMFRASDVFAGVLFVVLAGALGHGLTMAGWRWRAGQMALAIAGGASVADGWHPLRCTPSTDLSCRAHETAAGLLGQLRDEHTLSSVIGVVAIVVSMLLLREPYAGHQRGCLPGWAGLAAAATVGGLALLEVPLSAGDRGVGLVERVYVLFVSAWLATLGLLLADLDLVEQARSSRWRATLRRRLLHLGRSTRFSSGIR